MKIISLLTFFIFTIQVGHAKLDHLLEEFLESSLSIKMADLDYSTSQLSRNALRATRTWTGSLSAAQTDNEKIIQLIYTIGYQQ